MFGIFSQTNLYKLLRLPALAPVAFRSRQYLKRRAIPELETLRDDRNFVYRYFESQFRFRSPGWIWKHNRYFASEGRGFGEPAFHIAWYEIIKFYKPRRMLEIGVYRGQVISLWTLIGREIGLSIEVAGLSPFTNLGDSVSQYQSLDFIADIKSHFKYFKIANPTLIQANSTSVEGKSIIETGKWDLIYIDGSHDHADVLSDYESSITGLSDSGILVLDDSSLYLDQSIHPGRFSGHPGPSEVCRDRAIPELTWLLSVGHMNFFLKSSR